MSSISHFQCGQTIGKIVTREGEGREKFCTYIQVKGEKKDLREKRDRRERRGNGENKSINVYVNASLSQLVIPHWLYPVDLLQVMQYLYCAVCSSSECLNRSEGLSNMGLGHVRVKECMMSSILD